MDFKFSISFGKGTKSEHLKAIEYASEFDQFTPGGPGNSLNVVETDNNEVLRKYYYFQELVNTIEEWEQASIKFADTETDPVNFYLNTKDVSECYLDYQKSKSKSVYCDTENPGCWGCRQLQGIIRDHTRAPYSERAKYWYQYGAFTDDNIWAVNKEELSRVLTALVERKSLHFCPVFLDSFYRKIVAALPAQIDLKDTQNWEPRYLEEIGAETKQWKPVNVKHKSSLALAETAKKALVKDPDPALKTLSAGRVQENKNLRNIPETSFGDIGGIADTIQKIREVIELPLKVPDLYDHLGIRPFRGILLWGEPGNGKTLIAKAIAHEVRAHFIPIAGPDILNKSFGESEKNLREIFEEAKSLQPAIIFIDEIDSIAQSRLAGETSKWYATVVNQLLSLMDGIKEFGNVTILASTNRPDLLDPALLRPGRFDYKLEIRRPNLHGCKEILEIVTRGMPLADDADLFSFAESVIGFSAAEIAFIAKEAAMVAIRRSMDIKSIIKEESSIPDFAHLFVKRSDFFSAIVTLKINSRYKNKTYSLKG